MTTPLATRLAFQADPTDPRHGTYNGYSNLRCRCQPCKDANTAQVLAYRNSHPGQLERISKYGRARYASRCSA